MQTSVQIERDVPGSTDKRTAERFALLLLRSAKLLGDGVEYLCIVRDVSATGAKLRLFHDLPAARSWHLETADGDHLAMERIWTRDSHAGFRFLQPIDVAAFVSAKSVFPRRPVRLRVHHPAVLSAGGVTMPAILQDLSRQGACIESSGRLAIGQKLQLQARELPALEATVCWRREPHYGVVFNRLMTLEELAQRTMRIVQGGS